MQLSANQVKVGDKLFFPGNSRRSATFEKVIRIGKGSFSGHKCIRLWLGPGYYSDQMPNSVVSIDRTN